MTEKRRPGRPKGQGTGKQYTERLQIMITPAQRERLDAVAQSQTEAAGKVVTVAELIRLAIDEKYP